MTENPESLSSELELAQKPVLKVLQHRGSRLAIKLEAIFWSALSDIAKDQKTKTSRVVFDMLSQLQPHQNKTSFLRCLCLDNLRRRQQPMSALANQSFDLMTIIASCPTPVAIMSHMQKLVAINPAFSNLVAQLRTDPSAGKRAINMSFSEPFPKIVSNLIAQPQNIRTYQVGIQIGEGRARQFQARFAQVDRNKGAESLIVVYLLP
jgi:predicted DNA-binding ribbon-helix-helix protein